MIALLAKTPIMDFDLHPTTVIDLSNPALVGDHHHSSFAPFSQPLQTTALLPVSNQMAQTVDYGSRDRAFLTQAKRRKVNGTPNDDARLIARGDTVLKGLAGNDTLIAKKSNNVLIGGGDDDTLNAKKGRGENILKGGGGADELIGGGRNDLLVGGGGADILVIADGKFNQGISIIKGFKQSDAIAFRNVNQADEFSDLSFKKQGKDTLIRVGKRDIALVQKTKPGELRARADSFLFGNGVEIPVELPPDNPPADPPVITDPVIPPEPGRLTIDNQTIPEGNTNGAIELTVNLDSAVATPVTVNYSTADGTAIAGSDYTAVSGTLTFAANTTSQTIAVPILGDDIVESDETFTVTLSNAVGGTIATTQATATILNDDEPPETRDSRTGKQITKPSASPDLDFQIFDTVKPDIEGDSALVIKDSNDSILVGQFDQAIENLEFINGFSDQNGIENYVVTDADLVFGVGNLTATRSGNFITYLFSSDSYDAVIRGFYSDSDGEIVVIHDEQGLSGEVLTLTIDLSPTATFPVPNDFDADRAVNDLDYIIANTVFQYTFQGTAYGGVDVTDLEFQPGLNGDPICGDGDCIDLS